MLLTSPAKEQSGERGLFHRWHWMDSCPHTRNVINADTDLRKTKLESSELPVRCTIMKHCPRAQDQACAACSLAKTSKTNKRKFREEKMSAKDAVHKEKMSHTLGAEDVEQGQYPNGKRTLDAHNPLKSEQTIWTPRRWQGEREHTGQPRPGSSRLRSTTPGADAVQSTNAADAGQDQVEGALTLGWWR